MKVILLQDVRGLGKKNEVKEVSDGHARHFLIPKKLAVPAIPSALAHREAELARSRAREEAELVHLKAAAASLAAQPLEFALRADGKSVFGSVTKEMILAALRERGLPDSSRPEIKLAHPVRELGEFKVSVDFKKEVTAEVTLRVRSQP